MNASEALLPGEDRATSSAADIEYWLETYTGLIARCRQRGLAFPRFEARLAYWQRRHLGEPALGDLQLRPCGDTSSSTPRRCPFSTLGLNSGVMAACPGFDAESVTFANLTEETSVTGTSCRHIRVQRSALGFAAFCALSDGGPVSGVADPTAGHAA